MPTPTRLHRRNAVVLESTWSDGLEFAIMLSDLRDACPCAFCTGEEIMGQKVFAGMKTFAPGMNDLVGLVAVGNYAVQANWGDGHDTGMFSWEMLRRMFEEKNLNAETLQRIDEQLVGSGS